MPLAFRPLLPDRPLHWLKTNITSQRPACSTLTSLPLPERYTITLFVPVDANGTAATLEVPSRVTLHVRTDSEGPGKSKTKEREEGEGRLQVQVTPMPGGHR
jgi:hypothetical protein